LKDPKAVAALIEIMEKDEYLYVIKRAAEALGKIGDPRAASPLRKVVDTVSDDDTKNAAQEALTQVTVVRPR
jgi:HEAT repeat protein